MKYDKSYAQHCAKNLRRLRAERKLTLRELEALVGLRCQTLWRLEHGDMPEMLSALMLADFYGITLDELMKPSVTAADKQLEVLESEMGCLR